MRVKWEFFLERGVAPLRGTIEVDDDAADDDIMEALEPKVMEIAWSRLTFERVTNPPEKKP
jgi:hypothetical protein